MSVGQRGLGLEFWVENVVPRAVHRVSAHRDGTPLHLVGWCLGGIFSLLTAADRAQLPAHTITAVASPFYVSAVPLVAPLRPLAAITGGPLVSSGYQALGSISAP